MEEITRGLVRAVRGGWAATEKEQVGCILDLAALAIERLGEIDQFVGASDRGACSLPRSGTVRRKSFTVNRVSDVP